MCIRDSGYDFQDGTLTLFSGSQFAYKKLDDAKNRPLIGQALVESHGAEINVLINAEKKPPQDEKLAAVATMMGGGEEVKLEEIS